ncbi:CHAT domain-containing tetratricopeptide repeat protein [Streptomyces sp. NBC_01716]|uniref:CHAT domain-containing tetratricopeptide repeat protein n=1 Tax=Streptomyces sp. NBC_01716 TaxID=2975917 RepID=UPI002E33D2DC|nr:CHAT domain-containing protein [Streptomyces sp. NBC_01716]
MNAAHRILRQSERAESEPAALEWFLGAEAWEAADEVRGGVVLPDGNIWALGVLALGHLDWCRYLAGGEADRTALGAALLRFAGIHEQDPAQVPDGLGPLFATLSGAPEGAGTEPGFAYDGGVGVALMFQQSRHPGALPMAEALLRHAVAGFGEGSLEQGVCLSDLGIVLLYRFQEGAGRHTISEAVDTGRAAVVCAPGDRDEQARRHGNLGYTLRHWSEVSANREAMREAVAELRRSVELCTWNNPMRAQHTATLGSALCVAARELVEPGLLSEGIALLRAVLSEPDVVIPQRPSFLSDLGVALILRAMESGDDAERYEEGIATGRAAADMAPNAVERTLYLTNLALLLAGRAVRTGHLDAFDDAYTTSREALEGAPPGHPALAQAHFVLAGVLGSRHAATGIIADLDEAVSHARRGMEMTSVLTDDLRRRVNHGTRLADLLRKRAALRPASTPHGPGELHEAITLLRGLAEDLPARTTERARVLLALGRCLIASDPDPDRGTDPDPDTGADADEAADCFRKCLALPPPSDDFEATARFELGSALAGRAGTDDDAWQRCGDEMLRAIELLPPGDPLRWDYESEYARVLVNRADTMSGVSGVDAFEEALDLYREATRLLRKVMADLPRIRVTAGATCRSHLGTVLAKLGLRTGRVEFFADAVTSHREAVAMTSAQDHFRVHRLGALGESLLALGEFGSDPELLREGVGVLREALAGADDATPGRAACLSSLGDTLRTLARFTGDPAPLEESVRCHREALAIAAGQPTAVALLNIANSLADHYRHTRDVQQSDEAMRLFRAALAAEQPTVDLRGIILMCLGNAEWYRAVDSRDETLMDTAIGTLREAVTTVPKARLGMALTNLGGALMNRSSVTGNRVWLAEGVTVLRRAVRESPPTAMERSMHLNNLAEALRCWCEIVGDTSAADEAAALLREAMAMEHGDRLGTDAAAMNLGLLLTSRAQWDEDPHAAGEARRVLEEVVAGLGEQHPSRSAALLNLATSCSIAAHLARESTGATARQALRRAVTVTRESLAGMPEGHPDLSRARLILAQVQLDRAALGEQVDFGEVARDARACAHDPVAHGTNRIVAARVWGKASALAGHHTDALDGHAYAVGLLSTIAPRSLARADQEARLSVSEGLASDAAALALDEGAAGRALALLEQGRGVLLAQGLENRADVSQLRALAPAMAAEFERIRDRLSAPPQLPVALRTGPGGPAVPPHDDREAGVIAEARHALSQRWSQLLAEIRELPGLDGFLRPPSVPDLATAATEGPVVVVNVSEYRCDALVVTADAGIDVVPLPALTPDAVLSRAAEFVDAIDAAYGGNGVDNAVAAMRTLSGTLSWLWDTVTAPVLDRLGLDAVPHDGAPWPRLWWCPTGLLSFLPLHAAGRGAPDSGTWVIDRAVSSYTPTLRALVRARDGLNSGAPVRPSPLVVALPETPGAEPLPGASREAELLAELFPARRLLAGTDATVDAVVQALAAHSWVHFSCHGVSELLSPSQSGLILHDGRLTASDAAAQRLGSPELAMLSACSTSQGGITLPDEAVHLMSSFQLAGYPHVIGTLWTVSDELATRLTEEFYASLARDIAGGRPIDPAEALHRPVRSLRDRYAQAPHLWAAHIHTGP